MKIGGFQPQSLIEYPGKVSSVVFLSGCNFRCPFCHNFDLVLPDKIKKMKGGDERRILSRLKGDKLLDAVCVTGGEPTLQEDLPDFLKKVKGMGLSVALETNGSRPEAIEELIKRKLIDRVMMDIKSCREEYDKASGVDVDMEKIQKSIDMIREMKDYEFRMTVVPKLHDKDVLIKIGEWLKGSKTFVLQQFKPDKTLDKSFQCVKPYTEEKLKQFKKELKPYFGRVSVRNV